VKLESGPLEGSDDEAIAVHGRADHHPARAGGGSEDCGRLSLGQVRRDGSVRGAPAEGARGLEHQAQEASRRCHARQRGAEGSPCKKVTPAARREAVAHVRTRFELSERRACTIVAVDRKVIRYRSRRAPDGAPRDGCGSLRRSVGASATDVFMSCSGRKAWSATGSARSADIAKRA
jgi:hypothetical protein